MGRFYERGRGKRVDVGGWVSGGGESESAATEGSSLFCFDARALAGWLGWLGEDGRTARKGASTAAARARVRQQLWRTCASQSGDECNPGAREMKLARSAAQSPNSTLAVHIGGLAGWLADDDDDDDDIHDVHFIQRRAYITLTHTHTQQRYSLGTLSERRAPFP